MRRWVSDADWGIKDSFAALNLEPLGFPLLLFDAQWFGVASDPLSEEDGIDWHVVEDEAGLADWHQAWGETSGVFPPSLLDDPNITFALTRSGEAISAGAIFNRHDGVCGFSNFFAAAGEHAQFFPSAMAKARAWSGGLAVVGYTSEAALNALTFDGLEQLGPLRSGCSENERYFLTRFVSTPCGTRNPRLRICSLFVLTARIRSAAEFSGLLGEEK